MNTNESPQELYEKLRKDPLSIVSGLLFTSMRMADILIHDIDWRLSGMGSGFEKEKKKDFNRFIGLIADAKKYFNAVFEPSFQKSGGEDFDEYERTREDANEFIRLLLLYIEKCDDNVFKKKEVFDFLDSMEGGKGIISKKDIERYRLKRYDD